METFDKALLLMIPASKVELDIDPLKEEFVISKLLSVPLERLGLSHWDVESSVTFVREVESITPP